MKIQQYVTNGMRKIETYYCACAVSGCGNFLNVEKLPGIILDRTKEYKRKRSGILFNCIDDVICA